jgi:hypothetical protein
MIEFPSTLKEAVDEWPPEVLVEVFSAFIASKGYIDLDFNGVFGASPQIVDSYADLQQVMVRDKDGELVSITKSAGTVSYASSIAQGRFTLIARAGDGGSSWYFIPSKYNASCLNIAKTVKLTSEAENVNPET